MIGLVRSVAREYGPDQVRVNIICPGPTDTEMLTERWRGEEYRHSIPLDRFGTPEELARAIVDVAEWTWLTGQVISPNGGGWVQGGGWRPLCTAAPASSAPGIYGP